MPEPTEEPSDEDQTPTPIAKAGIEALTICGCGETGQVFGQQNFLSLFGNRQVLRVFYQYRRTASLLHCVIREEEIANRWTRGIRT